MAIRYELVLDAGLLTVVDMHYPERGWIFQLAAHDSDHARLLVRNLNENHRRAEMQRRGELQSAKVGKRQQTRYLEQSAAGGDSH
jgi:hypothetical protein